MCMAIGSRIEKPDRFKKIVYLWYNCKTCQVYFQRHFVIYFVGLLGTIFNKGDSK
jgi:hypothetical protein